MSNSPNIAGVAVRPPWKRVTAAMKSLAAIADAETQPESERRFEQFLDRAEKSGEYRDAAFAAAQALRDLDTLDAGEAAYLFQSLYDLGSDEYHDNDAELQRRLNELVDWTLHAGDAAKQGTAAAQAKWHEEQLHAAIARRMKELEAEFHRARGEFGLAEMLLDRPEAYGLLCAEGSLTLVDDKPPEAVDVQSDPDPRTVVRISERIVGLSATENSREAVREWHAFVDVMWNEGVPSGVAAVQTVRELGVITYEESLGLLDSIVSDVVLELRDVDRECARLTRAMTAIERTHGLSATQTFPEGTQPKEWLALQERLDLRWDGMMATHLRRFGEHRMANLLMENRVEYQRIVDEVSVGAWGVIEGSG